jgi:hypothetical protein
MAGTMERVAVEVARMLEPLTERLATGQVVPLFAELGLPLPPALAASPAVKDAVSAALSVLNAVPAAATGLVDADAGGDDAVAAALAELLMVMTGAYAAVRALGTAVRTAVTNAGQVSAPVQEVLADLPQRLIGFASVTYLLARRPAFGNLLALFGLVDDTVVPPDGDRPAYQFRKLRLDRLKVFLKDPLQALADLYGWGRPAAPLDAASLLGRLRDLTTAVGIPTSLVIGPDGRPELFGFMFQLGPAAGTPTQLDLGLNIVDFSGLDLPLPFGTTWAAHLRGTGGLNLGPVVRIEPPATLRPQAPAPGVNGELSVTFDRTSPPTGPIVLIGTATGTRLTVETIHVALGVAFEAGAGGVSARPVLDIELTGGKLVIDPAGADGFIAELLRGVRLEAAFDVAVTVDPEHGLQFRGSGGLETQIPVHVKLGALEIPQIVLGVRAGPAGPTLELSAGLSAALGVLDSVVDRVGVLVDLSFPDGGGNVGPAQLDVAFRPPTGVGLSVNAGIVAGGGFLSFDPERGEYAGVLELDFAGIVEVKAIGLITTRMPGGGTGFSLLIVLTAEFGGGGIQLGFGFTLLGVGGILGLNRRMDLDALVEGVVTGSVQSVMFPKDVVANAPRIISDLRKFFPPEDGTFLVGPMAKIGWGTPTLVSVSLGVIVEVPPGNIAILGVLECVLPSEDIPLLVLRVSFVGALEVDRSRLWFFAKLFDSRILSMTIDGGMGLLVVWGDSPDFVLSVGGFHPSFTPPPLPFPVPPRLSVDILNSPGQLIRVSGYFAITSNTVQFGAKAELRLGLSDFGVEGHLSFDALFRFSPFSFVVQISAGVSLKAFGVGVFGIDLNFTLEGPAPWRAHGRGSITLLFFEISADFDITWGEERTTTLPPVAVLELLAAEVDKTEGWQTRLPAGGSNPLVTLRTLTPGDDLVLHPLGSLFVQQRAIPLDVRIDRVGAQRPSDGRRFRVEPALNSGLVRRSVTGDKFAMAQFQDMDDAAKLSRPAYETQDAGLELVAAGGAIASARVVRRSARYELSIVDNEAPGMVGTMRAATAPVRDGRVRGQLYTPPATVFNQLLEGSSTARSPLSQQEARRRQPFAAEETVRVPGGRFVVAHLRNNQQAYPPAAASATSSSFRSVATAEDAMADWIHTDPALAGQLHVLRQAEVPGGVLAEPGVWSAAGAPPSAVAEADAVRLTDGQVLVAGGAGATGTAVATTALFDPVARTWAPQVRSLATARRRHTATRLGDGRVVVAGGLGTDGAPLATVEVFDPVTLSWSTPDATLATARSGHSATIADRLLLVAGGTSTRGAALASAELLDPATLTWTAVGSMLEARTGHAAVVLGTGAVLVVGGAVPTGDGERALASCELYDPATASWTATGSLAIPRKGHQATLLPGGKVLVTGGDAVPAIPYRVDSLASAEVYDPATGVWQPVADLPGGGRSGHRCVRTRRGAVVIGGVGRPRATAGYRDVVAFDPATGSWSPTGALATGRWDFTAVDLADGRVLAVGGRALTGPAAPGAAQLAATAETYLP